MDEGKGLLNGPKVMNGHALVGSTRSRGSASKSRASGVITHVFSIIARLFTWYAIITLLFRCPPTLDQCDENSPRICRPYFQLKETVAPYLTPYYDAYASPYVELARPYYGAVDRTVLVPAREFISVYGAPRLAQVQAVGQAQWEQAVQPYLLKLKSASKDQYDAHLASRVDSARRFLEPYVDIAKTNALQTYHELILPTYETVQPYTLKGYNAISAFATDTALPATAVAWNKTYAFLDGTVWPLLRVFYVENVEPQLVRIGQRLGRHHDTKAKPSMPEATLAPTIRKSSVRTSFTRPTVSAVSSSTVPAETESATHSAVDSSTSESTVRASMNSIVPEPPPPPGTKEDDVRRTAREIVAEDLKSWQEKFAKAADEGAAEIEERIDEISKRMIRRQARTMGKSLVEDLRVTIDKELVKLRSAIIRVVEESQKAGANVDAEASREKIAGAVRAAGLAIRDKAQDVRDWRENYETEMRAAITKAAENHFLILDSIRDLALQKIGMKWAWTDGITYKDWAKYHQLRDRFDEWRNELEQLVVTHPALEEAQKAATDLEDLAMDYAQDAAKELARLKQVGMWKVIAGDTSDEFDSDKMKAAADAVTAPVAEGSTPETGEPSGEVDPPTPEPAEAETIQLPPERPAEEALERSEAPEVNLLAEEQAAPEATATSPTAEPVDADEAVEASEAHEVVDVPETPEVVDVPEAPEVVDVPEAPEVVDVPEAPGVVEEPEAPEVVDMPEAPEVVDVTEAPEVVDVTEIPEVVEVPEAPEVADVPEAPEVKDAPETAEVKDVPEPTEVTEATRPIPEPEQEVLAAPMESPTIQQPQVDLPNKSDSTPAVDDDDGIWIETRTAAPQGETATVRSAMFGAAAQQVPNHTPILDTLEDVEASASKSAAVVVHAIQSDLPASIAALAHSVYSAALSQASEYYSNAMSMVSAQVRAAPTPEPTHDAMFASVTSAYNAAVKSARSRFGEGLIAAQAALGIPAPTPTTTPGPWAAQVESIARSRLAEGRAWAEKQYESAKSALGVAAPTPTKPPTHVERLLDQARLNYYAALGMAHARYDEFVAAASAALVSLTAGLPSPTPTTPTDIKGSASSMASVASANVVAAGEKIAEAWGGALSDISTRIYGAPTPTALDSQWYDAVYTAASDNIAAATSVVGAYAAAATDGAERQYAALSALISELLVGKEPPFTESVYSRLSSAYSTATAEAGKATQAAKEKAGKRRDEL